ncbi:MAG: hypothetical protein Q8P30_03870 [Candidatus Uhrbacteria bacterium]|nr:hypothetical protein [Candidatus Uhrbacteria bacterium]
MADVLDTKIKTPIGADKYKVADDLVIHTMPKEFIGMGAGLKVQQKEVNAPPLPPGPPKIAPLKKIVKPEAPSRMPFLIAGGGIIAIALLAIISVFVFQGMAVDQEVVVDEIVDTIVEEDVVVDTEVLEEEVEVAQGKDTDSDGLTDVEEKLYGTDYRNPDTDGDTFLDGNEVFHRYDPLGFAPSTLFDTGSVDIINTTSEDGTLMFSVYYPSTWSAEEVASTFGGAGNLAFNTKETAEIKVNRYRRTENQDFTDWYDEVISPNNGAEDFVAITSKVGYSGYMSNDKLIAYLILDDWFFEFEYDLSEDTTIEYLQTFLMMLNSFEFTP